MRNQSSLNRSLFLFAGMCCALALTSCDKIGKPYTRQGWATQTITAATCGDVATNDKKLPSYNPCAFASRDEAGNILPEGEVVSYVDLEKGRKAYMHYCYACHGVEGDGKGPSSYGLRPPPRDFRLQEYKFAAVKDGLPNDWDFMRIIRGGLHGSAMLEWDIPESELALIVDFIKTFPPRPCDRGTEPVEGTFASKEEYAAAKKSFDEQNKKCDDEAATYPNGKPNAFQGRLGLDKALAASGRKMDLKLIKSTGEPIRVPEVDPWAGKIEQALQVGKELYHLRAQCVSCHPGYITKQEFATLMKTDQPTFRDDLYFSTVIVAAKNSYGVNIMPPDFTMNPLRSIRSRERDANNQWVQLDPVRELWRLIASGIGGTGMPSWKDSITDDEIWALAHYIKSLTDLRLIENKAPRKALHDALDNQQPLRVKAPPPEPEPAPEEATPEGSASPDGSAAPEGSAAPTGSAAPKPDASAAPKAPKTKEDNAPEAKP